METAQISSGRQFRGMAGRWATERFAEALRTGQEFNASALRTLDTLRKDEWVHFDEALVEEGKIRLKGIADLVRLGLVIPVPNAMGRTIFQYEQSTDMEPAELSLSGLSRTEDDRLEFLLNSLPLPILHKDFNINLRTLMASRQRGEALDTTQSRVAGRLVAELLERIYFQGTSTSFGGFPIYGLTTHPNRNTASYGTGGAWTGSKTGEQILADILTMLTALEGDRMFGPYHLYVSANSSIILNQDFKANSDKSIMSRLLEVNGLSGITVADQMPASTVVLVQMTRDVVALIDGEPLQTVQWDMYGGFQIAFKAFSIQIPLVRADSDGRSGIFHMA